MTRIWLIGGTSESTFIADLLNSYHIAHTITVTTQAAQKLYPQMPSTKIMVGKLDLSQINLLLEQEKIVGVIDASHPYAVVISQQAITATQEKQIPYLRYERPETLRDSQGQIIELDSLETLIQGQYLLAKKVLLTIGYKSLELFQNWQKDSTLYARILPAVNSLEVAIKAGFTSNRLIALRPPISAELEKALCRQWQISLIVTKASGDASGEHIKQLVAAELGIPLIVIARPKIVYPQQTRDFSQVLAFALKNFIKKESRYA